MTVKEIMEELKRLPMDAKVTDDSCHEVSDICFEPDEEDHTKVNVWFSVNPWTTYEEKEMMK